MEKINNQKIFSYVPSLLIKIILETPLKDKDVFSRLSTKPIPKSNKNLTAFSSNFINPDIFPIETILPSSLIMTVKLRGFHKLMSTLVVKDPKNQKEKLISEYLSIITPHVLLKLSGIISENGGEIIKYNDFEFTAIWTNPNNKNIKYNKFNAKLGLISAIDIMKKIDKTEISRGVKLEISIGMSMGDVSCVFFGGERKRSEFIIIGDAMELAKLSLKNSLPHEIVFSKEINDIFKKGTEITTMEVDENNHFYSLLGYCEEKIKDFSNFKGLKINNNIVYMNKAVYENLSNKIHILSSILPQGLIKYLDVGIEANLQEINMVTVVTILINLDIDINDDLYQIQNIIFDIQKATYLTFGTLLYISKISDGLLIRCVWGLDPGSFLDDTARAISSSSIIGSLTKYYKIKIGIGIATGSCFSGLISLQGNKKFFTMLGKKVNLSRFLAEEAYKNIIGDSKLKYLIYCDKITMKKSQKWYRHIYVSQLRIYLNKKSDSFYSSKDDFYYGERNGKIVKELNFDKSGNIQNLSDIEKSNRKYSKMKKKSKNNTKKSSLITTQKNEENENKSDDEEKEVKNNNLETEYHLINEIFAPIEEEEYFIPNYYDPFPLIRTHLNNSYNPKNKLYYNNLLTMGNNENLYECKNPRFHTMTQSSIHKAQSDPKIMVKLLKSQTIFGHSKYIQKFVNIINSVCCNCSRQFFLIKGPLGVGKTLFVRKGLNNFMGSNNFISKSYFTGAQFLFCNIMNPFTTTLPYNTINYVLREIFLNLKRIEKMKELFNVSEELKLDSEDLKNISFVLSIGKNDIDLKDEFGQFRPINRSNNKLIKLLQEKQKIKIHSSSLRTPIVSYIEKIEGPFNFKNTLKLNKFFFEMIKIYKNYLNNIQVFENNNSLRKNTSKEKNKDKNVIKKIPLIFILDDIHVSNNYSYDFIQYLFNSKDKELNPFIIILIEQTPFNDNFRPLTHRFFETFLLSFSEYCDKPNENKLICFDIKPLMEKKEIEKMIIYYYKEKVLNNYKTNLESVDDKIIDFLLMKSFHGIPLLVLSLFESLVKSEKFIQTLSGEFIITSELMDDNIICDWSDLLLPYVYEKITSMYINNLLSFKEILILKYASVIGTVFDIKTLDKMNPLKSIIKIKDLEKILLKLYNEYIIETFTEEIDNQKNKIQNLICQVSFPLMREVLHQKFPMEKRSTLHMKAAKLLSTSKKNTYFSIENELKILKRHLLYSEMNIINEIESKKLRTVQDILQNKKVLNYNNLKLYLVKEICSKFYNNYNGNIMEGNLEILINGSKWLKVSYFIDKRAKIFISLKNPKKISNEFIMIIPIKDIYKNKIIQKTSSKTKNNNLLEIYVSKETAPLKPKNKKIILFSSEQREEICKLDITINFLRVKVNYDKYVYNYGLSRFPLYKSKWYRQKSLLYYAHLEQNGINIQNMSTMNSLINLKKVNSSYSETFNVKIFNKSKIIKKSFIIIFQSTLSIFLGKIQEKLCLKQRNLNENDEDSKLSFIRTYNYLYNFSTPKHIERKINKFLKSARGDIDKINYDIYIYGKASFRESLLPMSYFSSLKKDTNMKKNSIFQSCVKNKLDKNKNKNENNKEKNKKAKKPDEKKNNKSIGFKRNKTLNYTNNESNKNNKKNKLIKHKKYSFFENDNTINNNSKKRNRHKLSLFAPDILRRSTRRYKTKMEKQNINRESLLRASKISNDKFSKVQKINQNVENDDINISDFDFNDEIVNISISNNVVQSFDSSKMVNSDEEKDNNFIPYINEMNNPKFNIQKKLNIPKKYENDNGDNNGLFTYREKNRFNLLTSKINEIEEIKNTFNTSRDYQDNDDDDERGNLHKKINKKYDEVILPNNHKIKKSKKLPGDFVPKIKEFDKIGQHIQLIPSTERTTRILIHTLDNSFNKSFNEIFNSSFNKLKPASLLDNPKYAYLEDNYNNVKVHKSKLFIKK